MNQAAGQSYDNGYYNSQTEYSAVPTIGTWKIRDFVKNVYPTVKTDADTKQYILWGWLCTTAGISNNVAWAGITICTVGQRVYATNKVYECTIAGTSGTVAPSHSSGTAADGTVTWQMVGALGVFKEFKAMLGA